MDEQINMLIVVRHPLGGIRTYMRYMFRHFPSNYRLTILAASTQEDDAIKKDVVEYGARLLLVDCESISIFAADIFKELRGKKYDLILSQGFISAFTVYFANLIFKVPHILTIHGILEPRFFVGWFSGIKRLLIYRVLRGVTALYGVSNDILNHVLDQIPELKNNGPKTIVIPNGIEVSDFVAENPNVINLREVFDIDPSTFIFGFFGRFMPQKGFDLLLKAVDILRQECGTRAFKVVAVGSGDYIRELQQNIRDMRIEDRFIFLPFQPQVYQLYPQIDAIVMPSRWEAGPIQPMEVLCMGTPLIASDCIGLRETVAGTPAMVFPTEDVTSLVANMRKCMDNDSTAEFKSFRPHAIERFEVANSARQLVNLIEAIVLKRN